MISLKDIARKFEDGLNVILNNSEIQFKIWADAGKYAKPERNGNSIVHQIVGNLRTSTSSNDTNNTLVMGVNGLSLDFMIPIYPPRTNAMLTEAQLAVIEDGQYPFLDYIANAINTYFQKAQVFTQEDNEGEVFTVAFQAGAVVPGSVELAPKFGNAVPYNVYIQLYFIQNGLNSKDVKISVDGEPMPFQAVRLGRAAVLERDLYAGETISKCFASSTAFSVDADFPASANTPTLGVQKFIFDGEPNTAHFVTVQWSNKVNKLFFMTYNTVQASVMGINVVGLSASFVEVGGNQALYNLPQGFKTVRFTLSDSQTKTLLFTLPRQCSTFIAGVGAVNRNGAQTVNLAPTSFQYDEDNDIYSVDMVVDGEIIITNASAPFTII